MRFLLTIAVLALILAYFQVTAQEAAEEESLPELTRVRRQFGFGRGGYGGFGRGGFGHGGFGRGGFGGGFGGFGGGFGHRGGFYG